MLKSQLTQSYLIKPDDTLQKIVSDKFAVGPTAAPELYAQMVARIQALNDIPNPDGIRAGSQLRLPDLPPNQWKEPNPVNRNYGLPRLQGGPSYSAVLSGVGPAATSDAWRIFDAGRKAEPLVNQWRWVTVEEAKAEATASSGSTGLTFWSQPITLKLAQTTPAVGSHCEGLGGGSARKRHS